MKLVTQKIYDNIMIDIIQKVGRLVEVVVDTARLRPEGSEVTRLLSDNTLAREKLSWHPAVDLDQGLEKTISWIEKHLEYYRIGQYEF